MWLPPTLQPEAQYHSGGYNSSTLLEIADTMNAVPRKWRPAPKPPWRVRWRSRHCYADIHTCRRGPHGYMSARCYALIEPSTDKDIKAAYRWSELERQALERFTHPPIWSPQSEVRLAAVRGVLLLPVVLNLPVVGVWSAGGVPPAGGRSISQHA
jgi:hypothetical protein